MCFQQKHCVWFVVEIPGLYNQLDILKKIIILQYFKTLKMQKDVGMACQKCGNKVGMI